MMINDVQLINDVEVLKHAFKDKKVKWFLTLKIITLVKPDCISLFICLILLIFLNTSKTNYIFDHFNKILIHIGIMIAYDLIDYIFLRKFKVEIMLAVEDEVTFSDFYYSLVKLYYFLQLLL